MELAVTIVQEDGVWELLGVVETQAAGRDIAEAWWALRQERGRPSSRRTTTRKTLALAPFDGRAPDFGNGWKRSDSPSWQGSVC